MTDYFPKQTLRENGDRARLAINLIWSVLIIDVLMMIQEYRFNSVLRRMVQGDRPSQGTLQSVATMEQLLGIIYTIAFVISIVTFIRWFRRAYYNLGILTHGTQFEEGWAAGAWFVPVLCLFRPYNIMKELYEKSESYLREKVQDYIPWLTTTMVGWWWGFWILSNLIGQITLRLTFRAKTAEELLNVSNLSLIQDPISIILSLLAIKVIKDYASNEAYLEQITFSVNIPPIPEIPNSPNFPPLPNMENSPLT